MTTKQQIPFGDDNQNGNGKNNCDGKNNGNSRSSACGEG